MDRYKFVGRIASSNETAYGACFVSGKIVITAFHVINTLVEREQNKTAYIQIAELPGVKIPLVRTIDIFPTEDVIIFELDHPPIEERYYPTAIQSKFLKSLEVEIYLNRVRWMDYKIEGGGPRGVVSTIVPKGEKVDDWVQRGDSGSPVWLDDMVVGIVRQATKMGEMAFQPFTKDILKKIPHKVYELGHFSMPYYYLRRKEEYDSILELLTETPKKPVILYGESGSGKSLLSKDVGNQFESVLILKTKEDFAKADVSSLKQSYDLVIIDDYLNNDTLNEIIRSIKLPTIICVSGKVVLDQLKTLHRAFNLIELKELSIEKAEKLLGPIEDELLKQEIIKFTGNPLFLNLFKQVDELSRKHGKMIAHNFRANSEIIELNAFEEWYKLIIKEYHSCPEILSLLSITHYGLDYISIAHILDKSIDHVDNIIEDLQKRGFLQVDKVVGAEYSPVFLHDKLSNMIMKMELQIKGVVTKKYYDFLNSPEAKNAPVLTRVDALVTKMKTMWKDLHEGKIEPQEFMRLSNQSTDQLQELLPSDGVTQQETQWVKDKFADCISGYCTEVIPLARIVNQFPRQPLFGEMLFQGAFQNIYDDEKDSENARAHLIYAAIHHWCDSPGDDQESIAVQLEGYLKRDVFKLRDSRSIDMEVAVIFSGLCEFDNADRAVDIVGSEEYREAYPYSQLAILTLLACLEKTQKDAEIEQIVREFSHSIMESSAKHDMEDFLISRGYPIKMEKCEHDCYKLADGQDSTFLSRTVSLASRNHRLDEYLVTEKERKYSILG